MIALKYRHGHIGKDVSIADVTYRFTARAGVSIALIADEHVNALLNLRESCCGGRRRRRMFFRTSEREVNAWKSSA